jgi:hypothetical protein
VSITIEEVQEWVEERIGELKKAESRLPKLIEAGKLKPSAKGVLRGAREALEDVLDLLVEREQAHNGQAWVVEGASPPRQYEVEVGPPYVLDIPEEHRGAYLEVAKLFAQAFPGGLLVDTSQGGEIPQLRCGPYQATRRNPETGQVEEGDRWAVVRFADGRRQIVTVKKDHVYVQMKVTEHAAH